MRRRLEARKTARFREVALPNDRIGAMCEAASGHPTGAIEVFAERVKDARAIGARLARAHGRERVAVLTGTLRGHERARLPSPVLRCPRACRRIRRAARRGAVRGAGFALSRCLDNGGGGLSDPLIFFVRDHC